MKMLKILTLAGALLLAACGNPNVVLKTDLGDIEIEVFEDKAPLSAADFLYHVDEGLYDRQGFYRAVRPDNDDRNMNMNVVQGGLLSVVPVTPSIDHEPTNMTGLTHNDGAVSIARDAVNTGSAAYFFISIGDNKFLDHGGARHPDGQGFAVFGKVTKGMDVVKKIQAMEGKTLDGLPGKQYLDAPVIIQSASRK